MEKDCLCHIRIVYIFISFVSVFHPSPLSFCFISIFTIFYRVSQQDNTALSRLRVEESAIHRAECIRPDFQRFCDYLISFNRYSSGRATGYVNDSFWIKRKITIWRYLFRVGLCDSLWLCAVQHGPHFLWLWLQMLPLIQWHIFFLPRFIFLSLSLIHFSSGFSSVLCAPRKNRSFSRIVSVFPGFIVRTMA